MDFELRSVERSRVYASIVDQIVEGVRSGAFLPGHALPAERLLAERLGVSRGSLREAIRVLEHAGVLDIRTGSGTYVSEAGVSKAALLRAQAEMIGEHSPLDIIVARRAVEPQCAELAAVHRHQRDVEVLRERIREQAELNARGEDPEEVDFSFHVAVAAASDNPVLLMLVERIVGIMRQGTWRELKHRTRARAGGADRYLDQHRAILVAIERLDPRGAALAMRQHLDAIESGLLAELR